MKRLNYIVPLAVIFAIFFACEDVFEEDLDNDRIVLLSPPDSFITNVLAHTLWWEPVEGALNYQVQIVSPNFNNIQQLVVDEVLENTVTIYEHTFTPGIYQWRVRATNGGSSTPYATRTITIDSTTDLTGQTVQLINPTNNDTTNQMQHIFQWAALFSATYYRLEVRSPDFNGTILFSDSTTNSSLNLTFTGEGSYGWGVRAENDESVSSYSSRGLYIDTAAPNTPVLLSPAQDSLFPSKQFTLSWDRGSVTGSSIRDSLFIYSDANRQNIALEEVVSATSYSDSLQTAGTYYWEVRSIDKATNTSDFSTLRTFRLP